MVKQKQSQLSEDEQFQLAQAILCGIPGEGDIQLEDLQRSLSVYESIGKEGLRANLFSFLRSIADTCMTNDIKMTIHPDDPPYPILGLPRVVSNKDDLMAIIDTVDQEFNGLCFCTGSLGAGAGNNLPDILENVKSRVYFVHLRNVKKDELGSFYEADHLDGDVDMHAIMRILTRENQLRDVAIPFRPDHGHQMLDDLNKITNPGYSAIGRLRGLAELRGLEYGILGNMN